MSFRGYLSTNTKVSKEDYEFYDLKNRAAEYYRTNGVPQKLEAALNLMFFEKPNDVYGYLANYFSRLSTPPVISRLLGKEVYDGKGQLTVQAEVLCIIRNEEKSMCSAVISSHHEAQGATQDPGVSESSTRSDSVMAACRWINEPLCALLKGFEPPDQTGVDKVLSDFFTARFLEYQDRLSKEQENEKPADPVHELTSPVAPPKDRKTADKGKKSNNLEKPIPPAELQVPLMPGSVAVGSVSLAVAKTAAQLKSTPLYQHVTALRHRQSPTEICVPLPMVTLLSCGKQSPGKLNLMEEVIIIPKARQRVKKIVKMVLELQQEITRILNAVSKTGPLLHTVADNGAMMVNYDRPEQPLDLITEACNNLGLVLGSEIHLAINCSAHDLMDYQKGKYDATTGTPKSPDELVELYQSLTSKHPSIIALVDPFRKEDREQWQKLRSALGPACSLISEVAFSPSSSHWTENPASPPLVGGFIVKHTNQTTVTDLIQITQQLEASHTVTIVGTTRGEPCCDSLSDLAVGLGAHFVKLGGLSRGERLTKYNRLISIEEELAQQGILGSKEAHGLLPLSSGKL